jgi:hypothetical protein
MPDAREARRPSPRGAGQGTREAPAQVDAMVLSGIRFAQRSVQIVPPGPKMFLVETALD